MHEPPAATADMAVLPGSEAEEYPSSRRKRGIQCTKERAEPIVRLRERVG